jgi:hypothetical protein
MQPISKTRKSNICKAFADFFHHTSTKMFDVPGMLEGPLPFDYQSETSDMLLRPRPALRLREATRFIALGNFGR